MNRWEAQYSFWSSFGIPAYDASSVPTGDDAPAYPYITYEGIAMPFGSDTIVNASIWTKSFKWTQANEISDRIEKALPVGIDYDEGRIWIMPEDVFSQNMADPNDDLIRRKLLTVVMHFA